MDEHLERLKIVLDRISKAKLKLKPEKCELLQSEVTFLGHVASGDGVRPNPTLVEKIQNWKEPCNVTEVRQYLGLCSYYRRFIKNFSNIAKPLTDLTKKDTALKWTDQCQQAFNNLKEALLGPHIMAFPSNNGNFILDTVPFDVGIGAVLSQIQD